MRRSMYFLLSRRLRRDRFLLLDRVLPYQCPQSFFTTFRLIIFYLHIIQPILALAEINKIFFCLPDQTLAGGISATVWKFKSYRAVDPLEAPCRDYVIIVQNSTVSEKTLSKLKLFNWLITIEPFDESGIYSSCWRCYRKTYLATPGILCEFVEIFELLLCVFAA